jgi:NAD(P)-dependent dehydrogenase (short-subunit alcohol dehydrogenase family)
MLVTGGGRGIGAATCRLAAERGYAVAINYVQRADAAEQLALELRELGARAITVGADVSDVAEVERMFETVDRELGRLNVLVNNAGILEAGARVDEMEPERIARTLAVNTLAPFLCARQAVRRMSTRHGGQGGNIVNVSSIASRYGSAGAFVDYAASKAGVDTFTIGLSREVAAERIRVNAVRPAVTRTEIHASGGDPDRASKIADSLPMKRPGEPIEVARAILWLCSDEASYCTGAILDVTGGR